MYVPCDCRSVNIFLRGPRDALELGATAYPPTAVVFHNAGHHRPCLLRSRFHLKIQYGSRHKENLPIRATLYNDSYYLAAIPRQNTKISHEILALHSVLELILVNQNQNRGVRTHPRLGAVGKSGPDIGGLRVQNGRTCRVAKSRVPLRNDYSCVAYLIGRLCFLCRQFMGNGKINSCRF